MGQLDDDKDENKYYGLGYLDDVGKWIQDSIKGIEDAIGKINTFSFWNLDWPMQTELNIQSTVVGFTKMGDYF